MSRKKSKAMKVASVFGFGLAGTLLGLAVADTIPDDEPDDDYEIVNDETELLDSPNSDE